MDKVSTKIKNQVPNNGPELVKEMNAAGERFMNDTALIDKMNKATAENVADAMSGGAFSIGGSVSVKVKNRIDDTMKQSLGIDASTNIETSQNFSNDLKMILIKFQIQDVEHKLYKEILFKLEELCVML